LAILLHKRYAAVANAVVAVNLVSGTSRYI